MGKVGSKVFLISKNTLQIFLNYKNHEDSKGNLRIHILILNYV